MIPLMIHKENDGDRWSILICSTDDVRKLKAIVDAMKFDESHFG